MRSPSFKFQSYLFPRSIFFELMSNLKLREVIKLIRQCKTAAEERGVVSKESALIRNAFKVTTFHSCCSQNFAIGRKI